MRLTPGHKLAPPEPPSIAAALPTSQHSVSRATSLRVGGPARPTQVSYRGNGSKHEVLGASSVWTIFVCHVAISCSELRRSLRTRTSPYRPSANFAVTAFSEV